ncbi:hypothetical protein TWF730_010787 [Orbilia blumenaviensis]|uniref:VPS9 domain-containing protein n=1 Tax=Orbilia blumenaviensis TaxID=1796055 RepID=A0AAV9URV1_9PEZI
MHSESSPSRPIKTLGSVRSFTRLESQIPPTRSRSTTLNSISGPELASSPFGTFSEPNFTYDSGEDVESRHPNEPEDPIHDVSDKTFSQLALPPEILGMTDSFIESLSAKVHPSPVSIDSLSTMFQDFYETTAVAISAHVSRLYDSHDSRGSSQPLVSMSEIAQRKKDRKRKDGYRVALQELVEKKTTEAVFDKIWRHYSAEDEARDESLRSKTMALAVVGIGLKELGLEENINVMDLKPVCEALQSLNNTKCPHGKLQLLKRAHKAIVDVLTCVVPSTASSADHILPILIYSLIISPPDMHVVSNLQYIQRFRYHKAIDGETAYCLTNLEAAVSFLETVDMGTLATNELPVGTSVELEQIRAPTTSLPPLADKTDKVMTPTLAPAITDTSPATASQTTEGGQKETTVILPMTGATKRMTYLTPVEFATSAATTAVNTADQSLKTIGNSLENSYRFLFGKLSDKRTDLPKTLEDVRKLVGTPNQEQEPPGGSTVSDDLYLGNSERSGSFSKGGINTSPAKQVESVETVRFTGEATTKTLLEHGAVANTSLETIESLPSHGAAYTPVADSVRNLGSHLGRFAGNINVIRSFSRGQIPKTPPPGPIGVDSDSAAAPPGARLDQFTTKIEPPISKFLDTDAANLRISDVDLLLQDYRRLAAALKNAGAFL